MSVPVQVREHTSYLEAELEKHMAASSAECQNYAKEVAGVSESIFRVLVLSGLCPRKPRLFPGIPLLFECLSAGALRAGFANFHLAPYRRPFGLIALGILGQISERQPQGRAGAEPSL